MSNTADNNLTYEHDTHESHAFESPHRVEECEEKTKSGELEHRVHLETDSLAGTSASLSPKSTLITDTKNGNPNLGVVRTRQSESNRPSTSIASPYNMSEGSSTKLQQKDYSPQVDELLPQATELAQVGLSLDCSCRLGSRPSRLGTSRRPWKSSSPWKSKQEM